MTSPSFARSLANWVHGPSADSARSNQATKFAATSATCQRTSTPSVVGTAVNVASRETRLNATASFKYTYCFQSPPPNTIILSLSGSNTAA